MLFTNSGRDKTDVTQCWVAEKEVHGGVEVGVRANGQDDEHVAKLYVISYMYRNSPKRMQCTSGSSESIMRWNCETCFRFPAFILFGNLWKKKIHQKNEIQRHSSLCIYFKSMSKIKTFSLEVHTPSAVCLICDKTNKVVLFLHFFIIIHSLPCTPTLGTLS
jgi:hypothetical protein